jgi:hypothetical protein
MPAFPVAGNGTSLSLVKGERAGGLLTAAHRDHVDESFVV